MNQTLFYQSGNTITQFAGEVVAFVTSELSVKDRWTEFSLFLADDSTWILQGVGRSRVDGEVDRYWSVQSRDVQDCLQSILGSDVSRLAKKLIAESLTNLAALPSDDDEYEGESP